MPPRTRRPRSSEQLPEQARALGDPTRYAIFRYLDEAAGPAGVGELTEHFGLNHNAIRQHLAKLRDAGLVLEEVNAPTGPGRPSLRYRPVPGAAERWDGASPHENLSIMLIKLLRGEGRPRAVGYDAGRELALEYGSDADAIEVLETVTRRFGFEPRCEQRRAGVDMVLERCPFVTTAQLASDIVCELHRGLAEGIAETAAGDVTVTELVVRQPQRAGCRLQLTFAPADTSA